MGRVATMMLQGRLSRTLGRLRGIAWVGLACSLCLINPAGSSAQEPATPVPAPFPTPVPAPFPTPVPPTFPTPVPTDPPVAAPATDPADWAEEYLQDPLADVAEPTLEQLRVSLADPELRRRVVREHFPRAQQLSEEDRLTFLREALASETFAVRQQAAIQLQRSGLLNQYLSELLRGLAIDPDPEIREIGILGMEGLVAIEQPDDEAYIASLIEALASDSQTLKDAASAQLTGIGAAAMPQLLDELGGDAERAAAAARVLVAIAQAGDHPAPAFAPAPEMSPEFAPEMAPELAPTPFPESAPRPRPGASIPRPDAPAGSLPEIFEKLDWQRPGGLQKPSIMRAPAPKSAASREPVPPPQTFESPQVRGVDPTQPTTVRVYYGTNREILDETPQVSFFQIASHVAIIAMAAVAAWLAFPFFRREDSDPDAAPSRKGLMRQILGAVALAVLAYFWSIPLLSEAYRARYAERQGVVFGPRRSADGEKHYGFCDVSIPPTHVVGEVETPTLGREDEEEHVILKRAELLAEEAFFAELRRVLETFDEPRGCFVFVHGYNVSFDAAAKRTAQIYYDLQFQGLPIFYSWPSRASFRHYFSDRNEVQFSRQLIKEFLLDVVERSGAERVHVIAHSMGADAVAGAIASMDSKQELFDQIILAAPDIDADVFLKQVVPRLSELSKRTTLYCSRNDWALQASYHFNDSWRAGDSSRGLLVAQGLDTIDASSIDTELLGHSYYGNCVDILKDVGQLFLNNPEPADRNLVNVPRQTEVPAWTFPRLLEEFDTPR